MSAVESHVTAAPTWLADMDFCHIDDGTGLRNTCGGGDDDAGYGEPITCPDYDGSAICPGCGLPCCPRCAQLYAIEDAMGVA